METKVFYLMNNNNFNMEIEKNLHICNYLNPNSHYVCYGETPWVNNLDFITSPENIIFTLKLKKDYRLVYFDFDCPMKEIYEYPKKTYISIYEPCLSWLKLFNVKGQFLLEKVHNLIQIFYKDKSILMKPTDTLETLGIEESESPTILLKWNLIDLNEEGILFYKFNNIIIDIVKVKLNIPFKENIIYNDNFTYKFGDKVLEKKYFLFRIWNQTFR
jgi:hypothetical protein